MTSIDCAEGGTGNKKVRDYLFPHFAVFHAVDLQHVGEGRVAGEGFHAGFRQVGLEGVHAGGDEGEVFGAEVVGLDAATELLVLPADLGAQVFDFHPSHALHFREDFFARGGHWFQVSGFKFHKFKFLAIPYITAFLHFVEKHVTLYGSSRNHFLYIAPNLFFIRRCKLTVADKSATISRYI